MDLFRAQRAVFAPRHAQAWLVALGFATLYLLTAVLGRASRVEGTQLALVWPAAAVGYLWLLWSTGRGRAWVDLLLLAALAWLANHLTGIGIELSGAFAVANAAHAAAAVWLVRRLGGGPQLRTGRDLGLLVLGAAVGSTLAAAVAAPAAALLIGQDLMTTFGVWALRNAANTFVFAAVVLRLADLGRRSFAPRRHPAECAGTVAVLTLAYLLVFGGADPLPLTSFVLPLTVWVALRFPTSVVAAHVLLAGGIVVALTAAGYGPYQGESPALRVALAQGFVAVLGLVGLTLALHRDERDRLMRELARRADQALEDGERTARQAALLETVLDTVDVAVVACDAGGRLTLFNRAAREFHGTDADPTVAPEVWASRFSLYREDGRTLLAPGEIPLTVALRGGHVHNQVIVIAPQDNPAHTVRCDGRQLTAADGRLLGAVVAQTDITRLQASEREFRQAFEHGPTPAARLDSSGAVEQVNPALRRLLALPTRTLVGRRLPELAAPGDRDRLADLLDSPAPGIVEIRMLRAGGDPLWCEVTATPLTALDLPSSDPACGQPRRVLVQILDVHDRRSREESLALAAHCDPLTGLANRAVATARLAAHAQRPHTDQMVVAYLDLDGFKQVNDTHGHDAGDAVLLATAERLRTVVRPCDDVVRLGGDEFVLLCPVKAAVPGPTADQAARLVLAEALAAVLAVRVEALLAEPVEYDGLLLPSGGSVGTVVVAGGSDPADVLTRADQAMYERKRGRKGRPVALSMSGPDAEARRLQALHGLDVLDTAADPVLDDLVRAAATVAGVPTSLVSLVDEHRQWFKARCGLDATETGRDISFCAHVVAGDSELHVSDATADPRFSDNPLVTGPLAIRSYAGFPLRTADGYVLGSLCVIGYEPGSLDDGQRQVLRTLARRASVRLTDRRAGNGRGTLPGPRGSGDRHEPTGAPV